MNPSRFSALLSLARVAEAHLVSAGEQPASSEHIAAARGHLAMLERELEAMRDEAAAKPRRTAVVLPFHLVGPAAAEGRTA